MSTKSEGLKIVPNMIQREGLVKNRILSKTFTIAPESDEANYLWIDTTLTFEGKKVKKDEIQVLLTISGNGRGFIESVYDVREFSKNQKTYSFEFNNLVPCN